MKISKVNHIRMGTMKTEDGKTGFLYNSPHLPNAKVDICSHINGVLNNAQRFKNDNGRDYSKTRGNKDAKSILLKDTKVQAYKNSDGYNVLALSSSKLNGKSNNSAKFKHQLFEYICEYANATAQEQHEMEQDILTLIREYIYGDDFEKENFDVINPGKRSIADAVAACRDEMDKIKARKKDKNRKDKTDTNKEKAKKNELRQNIRKAVNDALSDHYSRAIYGATDMEKYWISHFDAIVYNLFADGKNLDLGLLNNKRLASYMFREWKSYMAGKFIDMGKAVYHFTNLKESNLRDKKVYGAISHQYENGITSFDYEKIKAEETLNRDIANAVAFAANVFSINSTSPECRKTKNDPIIDIRDGKDRDFILDDIDRRVLQFFGGVSQWKDSEIVYMDKLELFKLFRHQIRILRNYTYHYSTKIMDNLGTERLNILKKIFNRQCEQISRVIVKKYYSNNLPMFYKEDDIGKLMTLIYEKKEPYPSQIPSFASVFKKKDFIKTICNSTLKPLNINVLEMNYSEKYTGALYFVLKEIYYNKFITDPDAYNRINDEIHALDSNGSNKFAVKSFKNRIMEIENNGVKDFSGLCQILLTDMNMQNGNKSIKMNRSKTSGENQIGSGKFQHYKMILIDVIGKAFIKYVATESIMKFLKDPIVREMPREEDFLNDWKANYTDHIVQKMNTNEGLYMSWYITSHFLTSKQINHLIGSIKEYVQYLENITARAKSVGISSAQYIRISEKKEYNNIITILEMVILLSGGISKNIEDYFDSADEYKKHLLMYYEEYPDNLKDEKNVILTKNAVFASMYGCESKLSNVVKITNQDIEKLTTLEEKLKPIFKKGECVTEKECQDIRKYQNMKNRVTLSDIITYSEIIINNISNMVSFSYMRERDSMYFSLGIAYLKLKFGSTVEDDSPLRRLSSGDGEIDIKDGALLYQIITYYTPQNKNRIIGLENGKAYYGYSKEQKDFETFLDHYSGDAFNNGRTLFEDLDKSEEYRKIRNYIDHMKYFAKNDKSILNLYSDLYNGFFSYELKLKKSIGFIISNSLEKYFVLPTLKYSDSIHEGKHCATICIDKCTSDKFTCKFKNKNQGGKLTTIKVEARDEQFVDDIVNIMNA